MKNLYQLQKNSTVEKRDYLASLFSLSENGTPLSKTGHLVTLIKLQLLLACHNEKSVSVIKKQHC
jgi:hypothetical protein